MKVLLFLNDLVIAFAIGALFALTLNLCHLNL